MIKRTISFLFILFVFYGAVAHYGQQAIFDFAREGNKLIIKMEFDKYHLLDNFEVDKLSEQKISDYILSHFKCKVNDISKEIKINTIDKESHHITISAELPLSSNDYKINSIYVFNSCLLEYHSEHTNTINFDLNNSYRSFQINQKRKKIRIDY